MAEFESAKFEEGEITPDQYLENVHRNKLFCPECKKAELHIVNRQKGDPFFKATRKEDHETDCQHYHVFVAQRELNRIIESIDPEDKERLFFLVERNLENSIRLLTDEKNNSLINNSNTGGLGNLRNSNKGSKNYKIESIPRIHVKNIHRKKNYFINSYVVLYGKVTIKVREGEEVNCKTKESFTTKRIIFQRENTFIFSISLNSSLKNQFTEQLDMKSKYNFAVFGKLFNLKKYPNFLGIELLSIEHLKILC